MARRTTRTTQAKLAAKKRAKAGAARGGAAAESQRLTRAREAALGELMPLFGGAVDSDPDAHLYRSLSEGPRDLPSWTHERQVELAFGLYVTDPLAKRILEIQKNYVVADGITYQVDLSEAEQEAERRAAAKKAAERAARKAAMAPVPPISGAAGAAGEEEQGQEQGRPAREADASGDGEDDGGEADQAPAEASDEPTADEIRAVIDRHWNDPDNLWPLKQHDRALALGLWGEQLYPAFVNPATGHVKIGRIDPRRIKEVRTDPENEERVVAVVLKDTVNAPGRVYKVVTVAEEGDGAGGGAEAGPAGYMVGDVGDLGAGGYDGVAFYFAVNRVQGARRGHSDLFHLIDWIDAYGGLLFDGIDAARLKGSFIWDVLLKGADDAAIKKWLAQNGSTPKPGSIRAHNENVTWTAAAPALDATQHAEMARLYRVHILGGAGLPEHWYGEGDSATRATAKEMSAPVLQGLKARQAYFCHMVEQVLRFQVDQAILCGALKGTAKTKERVRVIAPVFETKDVAGAAGALAQATNALAVAEDRKWITRDTGRKAFAIVADHLGAKIDADAEKNAVEAQDEAEGALEAEAKDAENAALREALAGAVAGRGVMPPRGSAASLATPAAGADEDA